MTYTPYLIAKYATGLDKEYQPWLLPDDAFETIFDAFVHRGVVHKRDGYAGYANGLKSTYCESRMVHRVTSESYGSGNGTAGAYLHTASNLPVRRGTVTITAGAQSAVDNGTGTFTTTPAGGTGTINYTTGSMSITFNAAVPGATPITVTYDYHQGEPVMGIMNFYTASNIRELIVADTKYVNKYNSSTDRFDDISTTTYTGTPNNFWSWVNYNSPEDDPRLLFVNNKDPIQNYNGTTITTYPVYTRSVQVTDEAYGTGTGITGPYAYVTANTPILKQSVSITAGAQTVTDNGQGELKGDGTGTVDYTTGAISVTFTTAVANPTPILVSYKYLTDAMVTCLQIFQLKDRLIILRPTEVGGAIKSKRIRISGFGIYGDTFTEEAPGAGLIDIPDDTWIMGATANRDDLIIFTEKATWLLKYTNNDVIPFTLDCIDTSRGCKAPFSAITYLNRSMAASPYGLIMSDGYRVERMDSMIPDYSFDEINPDKFDLCFSGFVDEDRDVYLLHPSPSQTESNRILVANYEEDNYTIYKIPLSCIGSYIESFSITWNDLTAANGFPNWDALTEKFGNWNAFSYSKGEPITLAGGHKGDIWKLNITEKQDNPLKIRGMTVVDVNTLRVETDFNNYAIGDYISLEAISGMTQANDKQAAIKAINTANRIFDLEIITTGFSAYTSGGIASRCIPMELVSKKFNPFSEMDKKVRCGWMYFYLTTARTNLTDASGDDVPALLDVEVYTNDTPFTTTPNFKYKVDASNMSTENGTKKWFKFWINQTARFVQFRITNNQAGAQIQIHAMMPGFQPVGRLI